MNKQGLCLCACSCMCRFQPNFAPFAESQQQSGMYMQRSYNSEVHLLPMAILMCKCQLQTCFIRPA